MYIIIVYMEYVTWTNFETSLGWKPETLKEGCNRWNEGRERETPTISARLSDLNFERRFFCFFRIPIFFSFPAACLLPMNNINTRHFTAATQRCNGLERVFSNLHAYTDYAWRKRKNTFLLVTLNKMPLKYTGCRLYDSGRQNRRSVHRSMPIQTVQQIQIFERRLQTNAVDSVCSRNRLPTSWTRYFGKTKKTRKNQVSPSVHSDITERENYINSRWHRLLILYIRNNIHIE